MASDCQDPPAKKLLEVLPVSLSAMFCRAGIPGFRGPYWSVSPWVAIWKTFGRVILNGPHSLVDQSSIKNVDTLGVDDAFFRSQVASR